MYQPFLFDTKQFTQGIFSSRIDKNYLNVQDLLVQLRKETAMIISTRKGLRERSYNGRNAEQIVYYDRLTPKAVRALNIAENTTQELHSLLQVIRILNSIELLKANRGIRKQLNSLIDQFNDLSIKAANDFKSKLKSLEAFHNSRDVDLLDSWSADVDVQLSPDRPPLWQPALPLFDAIGSGVRDLCKSKENNKDKKRLSNLTEAKAKLNEEIQKFLDLEQTWCGRAELAKTESHHDLVDYAEMRSRKYKVFATNVAQLLKDLDEFDTVVSIK